MNSSGEESQTPYFHIFGCNCYIKNDRDNLGKFDAKDDDGFLVGYSTVSKAYHVFNKRRQTLEETIHVKFDESDPFSSAPSFTDSDDIDQWANSYFQVPENDISKVSTLVAGSSSYIPDGFEEPNIVGCKIGFQFPIRKTSFSDSEIAQIPTRIFLGTLSSLSFPIRKTTFSDSENYLFRFGKLKNPNRNIVFSESD
ncbi:hypothetical protein OSB04_020003 [Centaurea solstitialis]|uniref:Retroviral polymerase SH3-like domain-containing protein n=1 Tax=Centaurea solstitialis TaxID=347529 RepID=A0AA38WCV9_9ASTR|nr:hypothetical protein OSB04_020003 [Centaurea solstitialis]